MIRLASSLVMRFDEFPLGQHLGVESWLQRRGLRPRRPHIEPKICFAIVWVGPVAMEAVVRKDRPNVAVEVEGLGFNGPPTPTPVGSENKNRDACASWNRFVNINSPWEAT